MSAKAADAHSGAWTISHHEAVRYERRPTLGERYESWRQSVSEKLSDADLAPDLASDIGSPRWFRGAGTMIALGAIAIAFWPGFAPLEAAPSTRIDDAARDEFRSQMILPLALGADTGRRMGATPVVSRLQNAPERPQVEVLATLARGDSFSRMLQRAGLSTGEARQVAAMVNGAMPLGEIEPGTTFDITLGRRTAPGEPRPLDALSFRARFDLQLALTRKGDALVLDPRPIRVDTTPLRIRGRVGAGLYRSARAAGAPSEAAQAYIRALNDHMSLDRVGANDEFDLIVEYKRAATGEVEMGKLIFAGLDRASGGPVQLLRWGRDGQFYEASGVGEQRSGLLRPTAGAVSSGYGMRRHPILGYRRMHSGLDFRGGYGAPIYAVTDGTVTFAGRNGGYGKFVRINHGGGLGTGYAHMSRIAVSNGSRVRRGQVIGYIGSTGLSTGPHLHYEMYRNGKKVNPNSVSFVTRAQLQGAELTRFRARLAEVKQIEPGAALASLEPTASEQEEPVREIDRIGLKARYE